MTEPSALPSPDELDLIVKSTYKNLSVYKKIAPI